MDFDIRECCAALRVSRSGFYRWQKAEPSRREKDNAQMVKQIKEVFAANKSRLLHSALGYQAPQKFEAVHFKKENNFFEEKVPITCSQKRNEVQESKRNKWKGPTRSVGSSPFMPDYDLERSEAF